jgi:hypothetical protein
MSRFLSNLVARQREDAPVLQPRLRSAFEPRNIAQPFIPIPTVIDDVEETDTPSLPSTVEANTPRSPQQQPHSPRQAPVQPPSIQTETPPAPSIAEDVGHQQASEQPFVPARQHRIQTDMQSSESAPERLARQQPVTRDDRRAPSLPQQQDIPTIRQQPAHSELSDADDTSANITIEETHSHETHIHPTEFLRETLPTITRIDTREQMVIEPGPKPTIPPNIEREKSDPDVGTLALPNIPPATLPSQPAPEPTINISIGHLEIRATMPQPHATVQQENVRPHTSLSEYLRRKKGN